jgi:hypothetical protein
VQQVLQRFSLYGLVGHAPENEACHHRAVRASQGRCVWVIGKVEAVAFRQLRWSVCFTHQHSTLPEGFRRIKPLFTKCVEVEFCELRLLGILRSSASVGVGRQTVVAVRGDAVVFLTGFLYRIDVDDSPVQVA